MTDRLFEMQQVAGRRFQAHSSAVLICNPVQKEALWEKSFPKNKSLFLERSGNLTGHKGGLYCHVSFEIEILKNLMQTVKITGKETECTSVWAKTGIILAYNLIYKCYIRASRVSETFES